MDNLRDSRLLLYRLGSVVCATPVRAVREVIPAVPPTRIPGAAEAVAGLVNLRGQLLTVVDGSRSAPGFSSDAQPESVLVLDRGDRMVGLAVDEVLDLADLPTESFKPDGAPPGIPPALVRGVGRHGGQPVVLLDTEALLAAHLG